MTNIFLGNTLTLSTENYSRILIGWANYVSANSETPINVVLGGGNRTYNQFPYTTGQTYNDAVAARAYLVSRGWTITDGGFVFDTDALAYITAVETADTQVLETEIRLTIDQFVVGCKADGIWDAIKASCIMAGARTLQGALVPLVGAAPTNFNFVSGDYNRQTGLKGNAATKYLNTNRNNNADPQNSKHLSVFKTVAPTSNTTSYIAAQVTTPIASSSRVSDNFNTLLLNINSPVLLNTIYTSTQLGFLGVSRPTSEILNQRANNTTTIVSNTSNTNFSNSTFVFARGLDGGINQPTDARLAFYSIGESLDLALLDARVTTLINALGAIP
jgi:hypothetical protein